MKGFSAVENAVRDWVERLSIPRSEFAGRPACPFAKRARYELVSGSPDFCRIALQDSAQRLLDNPDLDLAIVAFPELRDARTIATDIQCFNAGHEPNDVVALVSDPAQPTIVDGFQTTEGTMVIVLLQRRSALAVAQELLAPTSYYLNWTEADRAKVSV